MILPEVIQALHTQLLDWASDNDMRVSVTRDAFDVLELLTTGPQRGLVVLHWAGDEVEDIGMGELEGVASPVRNNIEITIGHSLGLDVVRDWRLFIGKGNRPPVLQQLEALRAHVLALVLPDGEDTDLHRFGYAGCEPVVTPEGVPLAAYRMRFIIVTSVHQVDDITVE